VLRPRLSTSTTLLVHVYSPQRHHDRNGGTTCATVDQLEYAWINLWSPTVARCTSEYSVQSCTCTRSNEASKLYVLALHINQVETSWSGTNEITTQEAIHEFDEAPVVQLLPVVPYCGGLTNVALS
jgi:hypothetical protein